MASSISVTSLRALDCVSSAGVKPRSRAEEAQHVSLADVVATQRAFVDLQGAAGASEHMPALAEDCFDRSVEANLAHLGHLQGVLVSALNGASACLGRRLVLLI